MRLFRRSRSVSESQPALPGPLPEQTVSRSRIDWRRAVPRLIILVVIFVGVVSGILWATGVIGRNEPATHGKAPAIAVQKDEKPARKTEPRKTESGKSTAGKPASSAVATQDRGALKSTQSSASAPASTSSPATASTPGAPATSTAPPSQSGALTDTGPGETAAIFIATTLISSIAYQINLRRRLS